MRRLRSRPVLALVIAVPTVLGLLALAGTFGGRTGPSAATRAALQSAISGGLIAAQAAPLPPMGTRGHRLSAATIARVRGDGRAQLARFYSGDGLAARYVQLDGALNEEAAGDVVYLDAGVDNLAMRDVRVDGSSATASGTAVLSLDVGQVQPDGSIRVAHPRNAMDLAFRLALDGDTWTIVSQAGTYVPGSEP